MVKETKTRSAIKSLTYVVTHEVLFFLIALGYTGNVATALSIALTASVVELAYHYLHERLWAHIDVKRKRKTK